MAPLRKRKHSDNKLDQLLRQGAANEKVDIDKAIISSSDRLLKEKIEFTTCAKPFDSMNEFKDAKLIVLDAAQEEAARKRIKAKLAGKSSRFEKPKTSKPTKKLKKTNK